MIEPILIKSGVILRRGATPHAVPVRSDALIQTVSMPPRPVASDEPTLLQLGANFTRAARQHQAAGRPQATDEQVAERFAICASATCANAKGETYYKPAGDGKGRCLHPQCGCQLRSVSLEGLAPNKLRWADQACPLGLWKSLLETPPAD